ncbi:hypothetical protein BSL78_11123 [Apostichopus japonicus]|uniref:Kielin/chordin-like protein n=1 Tax=Stichopus japonicus TaxID=307972 RepID=A0A2G8KVI4_STIJA|nr:hypothetical protein BSL78_11123 [Apostichopus japonicus]
MPSSQHTVNILAARNYGIDPATELDLTKAISLDIDNLHGVEQVPGLHNNAPAFLFEGTTRNVMLDDSYMMKLMNMLSTGTEFTMMVSFLQDKKNSGSIICISKDHNRYMDLFVSTRNGQIKFYYSHDGVVRSESFEVDLTPNEWHQVAITISGQEVTLHLDCEEAINVRIPEPDLTFSKRDLGLWLGQRGSEKALYKGYLQDAKIIAGTHGFVAQCPSAARECPTCGEYMDLVGLVATLEKKVKTMEFQLAGALNRLDHVESCECVKHCEYNGQSYAHGDKWMEACTSCTCTGGEVVCAPAVCEPVYCKNPVYQDGECCPSCLRNCSASNGAVIHHNEYYYQKNRGTFCSKYQCQVSPGCICFGRLLALCKWMELRDRYHRTLSPQCVPHPAVQLIRDSASQVAAVNSVKVTISAMLKTCVPHQRSVPPLTYLHECVCPGGFKGVGDTCVDVNECAEGSDAVMHCQEGTICVNIQGSYRCDCLPGYSRASDTHCTMQTLTPAPTPLSPHPSSQPTPTPTKQNRLNASLLVRMVDSVNYPENVHVLEALKENNVRMILTNVQKATHVIRDLCNNLQGSYECRCSPGGNCDPNCWISKKKSKKDGSTWDQGCQSCSCERGVMSCAPKVCDCSNSNVDIECCPHCEASLQCMHQSTGVIYEDKESWVYDCQICRCVSGFVECSPMECPTANCRDTYTPTGECCPRCQLHPSCDAVINSPQNLAEQTRCTANGVSYRSNERWLMDEDFCTECICMGGNICCHYNSLCESGL